MWTLPPSFIFTSKVHLFQQAETGILLEIKTEGELLIPGWHFWILKSVWNDQPYQVFHEVSQVLWINSILLRSATESHCWTWRLLRAVEWLDFVMLPLLPKILSIALRNKGKRSYSTLKAWTLECLFSFTMHNLWYRSLHFGLTGQLRVYPFQIIFMLSYLVYNLLNTLF